MKKFYFILTLVVLIPALQGQTIQFKFCGKTDFVIPTIDPITGKDQRNKAALKLDYLKIGLRGASQTNPFFVQGFTQTGSVDFADTILADECTIIVDSLGTCTKCNVCNNAWSTTNLNIGSVIGSLLTNVRVESKNNDMFIMSTGPNNLVCYETNKISLTGQANKKIDVNYNVEGISDGFNLKNMSLNYRYNSDAYFVTPYFFNKNSNIVGVFDEVGSIQASVPLPSSSEEVLQKINISFSPNPVEDELILNTIAFWDFDGTIKILNTNGQVIHIESHFFEKNKSELKIDMSPYSSGMYILQISDKKGNLNVLKFQKI
ncbi:MAG: T9SS type A sorting domain-containing protein [Saprospiraceae bacterium]